MSHDRYFMDKVVDHLLVFKGEGEIQDFPGNYTQYREWSRMQAKDEAEQAKPAKAEMQRQKATELARPSATPILRTSAR